VNGNGTDISLLVGTLDSHGVEYLVIGGMAIRAYGYDRPTADLDLLIDWTPPNRERLAGALADLNARERVAGIRPAEGPARPTPEFFARSRASMWWTDAGPVDVLASMPGANGKLRDFRFMASAAERRSVDGANFLVPPLNDVIGSKAGSTRAKHRRDRAELLEFLEHRRQQGASRQVECTPFAPGAANDANTSTTRLASAGRTS